MSTLLVESTAVPQATGKEGRWKAVLITPGEGSSGIHTESALRATGPRALRKGAKSFVTHNRLENGEPDPFQMWGFLAEDAYYEEGVGLVGEIEVLPSWRDKVSEVAPHTALSVYVSGTVDESNTVVEYLESVQNGVDMVVFPGRPGSGLVEKLYESAAKISSESSGDAPNERNDVDANEVKSLVESALKDALSPIIEALDALKPATPKDTADLAAVAEAAVAAGIPKEMRAGLYESAKELEPAAALALVESQATIVKSIKDAVLAEAQVTEAAGRVDVVQVASAADLGKVFG